MTEQDEAAISIEDFMALAEASPRDQKQYADTAYLGALTTDEARNSAHVAEALGVTPGTVVRRLGKLAGQVLTRYQGAEPFFVLKPAKGKKGKAKKSSGVEL